MAENVKRKEWEDRYDLIKNATPEQIETEYQIKNAELARKLAQIADTTSTEYREITSEKNALKKENDIIKANQYQIRKNIPLIEQTRENRDVYQEILDELIEKQKSNDEIIKRRQELEAKRQKLEDDLKDLQETEKHCLIAINNPDAPEENKARARETLQEIRSQISENHDEFSKNQNDLEKELQVPLAEIREGDKEELEDKINRCNRICELLVDGKTMGEVQSELGKTEPAQPVAPAQPTTGKTEPAEPVAPAQPTTGKTEPAEPVAPAQPTAGKAEPANTTTSAPAQPTAGKAEPANTTTSAPAQQTTGKAEPAKSAAPAQPKATSPLNTIHIDIDKEGSSINITREPTKKEGFGTITTPAYKSEKLELTNIENFKKISESHPKADKYVIREVWNAIDAGALTPQEGNKQLEIYTKILETQDETERETLKKELKLSLKYNLKGIRKSGLSTEDGSISELKANAKKAEDLGIGEVDAPFLTRAKWNIQDFWKNFRSGEWLKNAKNKAKNLLPKRKKTEELGPAKDEPVADQPAAEQTATTKRPGELSPEARKEQQQIQQEIAKTVTEIQEENQAKAKAEVDPNMSKLIKEGIDMAED